eukprot:TRINITY_DN3399_c0_g1_i10.p2 TRINITY_DN3399_c0_g1~~TRINITY_DN3399_c0_g1_i10.p2  ORF type:complete len:360 (-),score=64.12 TRINITY_DN3399_c0_g1_i10:261-1340(-)
MLQISVLNGATMLEQNTLQRSALQIKLLYYCLNSQQLDAKLGGQGTRWKVLICGILKVMVEDVKLVQKYRLPHVTILLQQLRRGTCDSDEEFASFCRDSLESLESYLHPRSTSAFPSQPLPVSTQNVDKTIQNYDALNNLELTLDDQIMEAGNGQKLQLNNSNNNIFQYDNNQRLEAQQKDINEEANNLNKQIILDKEAIHETKRDGQRQKSNNIPTVQDQNSQQDLQKGKLADFIPINVGYDNNVDVLPATQEEQNTNAINVPQEVDEGVAYVSLSQIKNTGNFVSQFNYDSPRITLENINQKQQEGEVSREVVEESDEDELPEIDSGQEDNDNNDDQVVGDNDGDEHVDNVRQASGI